METHTDIELDADALQLLNGEEARLYLGDRDPPKKKGDTPPMEIETDALQLLLAEESRLYDGELDPEPCGSTCKITCWFSVQ
ncbi:hypothetical protein [Streptomyces sp. NPDC002156]